MNHNAECMYRNHGRIGLSSKSLKFLPEKFWLGKAMLIFSVSKSHYLNVMVDCLFFSVWFCVIVPPTRWVSTCHTWKAHPCSSRAMVLSLTVHPTYLGGHIKTPIPGLCRSGVRICISNSFPGSADVAGVGTQFWQPVDRKWMEESVCLCVDNYRWIFTRFYKITIDLGKKWLVSEQI